MRIASYNVQRLRLRQAAGGPALDGARDGDWPPGIRQPTPITDAIDRRLTAKVLARLDADVVAMQEVFDQASLDYFHDAFVLAAGARPYPHRLCLPGNDGRGFDVALISRRPPDEVSSHADLSPQALGLGAAGGIAGDAPIFRRDCLVARFGALTVFNCHFKAPYPDQRRAFAVRRLEALAVRAIIERQSFHPQALWLIVGDLNEHTGPDVDDGQRAIAPLGDGFAIDLIARMPAGDRWSFQDPCTGLYSQPDAMLASPALAARWPHAVPFFQREGMRAGIPRFAGERLAGVGDERPHASDHAALAIDLPGL